jgi:hypothetical protein
MHPEASLRLIQILEKTVSPGMYVSLGKLIQTLVAVQRQNSLPTSRSVARNEKNAKCINIWMYMFLLVSSLMVKIC